MRSVRLFAIHAALSVSKGVSNGDLGHCIDIDLKGSDNVAGHE
jgi:hypothetical protein